MRTKAPLVLFGVQAVALAIVSSGDFPPSGFPLDDAWIHALAARTLIEHGTLGIVPGMHGAGATSTLWALVLAFGMLLGVSAPVFAFVLNTLLYFLAGQWLLVLLRADEPSDESNLLRAIPFCVAPNFVWFTLSGMEATLFSMASIMSIATWFSQNRRLLPWTGVGLVLLALTRPEGIALLPLLVLYKRPKSFREWLYLGLAPAVAVTVQGTVALLQTGHIWPATLAGRRWMWLAPLEGIDGPSRAIVLLYDWLDRIGEFTLGNLDHFSAWVVLGFAAWGAIAVWKRNAQRALVAWTLLHLTIYAVALPTLGHGGRYQPLVPAVFFWLGWEGVLRIIGDLRAGFSPVVARLGTAAIALATATFVAFGPASLLFAWRTAHAEAVAHVTDTEIAMARELDRLPREAIVASFDIGGIGYFTKRPVLEIGGLAHREIVPLFWKGKVGDFLIDRRADYVVVPLGLGGKRAHEPWNFGYRLGLIQDPRLELVPVATRESALAPWRRGVRFTMHCAPRQTLYRIHYRSGAQP